MKVCFIANKFREQKLSNCKARTKMLRDNHALWKVQGWLFRFIELKEGAVSMDKQKTWDRHNAFSMTHVWILYSDEIEWLKIRSTRCCIFAMTAFDFYFPTSFFLCFILIFYIETPSINFYHPCFWLEILFFFFSSRCRAPVEIADDRVFLFYY